MYLGARGRGLGIVGNLKKIRRKCKAPRRGAIAGEGETCKGPRFRIPWLSANAEEGKNRLVGVELPFLRRLTLPNRLRAQVARRSNGVKEKTPRKNKIFKVTRLRGDVSRTLLHQTFIWSARLQGPYKREGCGKI